MHVCGQRTISRAASPLRQWVPGIEFRSGVSAASVGSYCRPLSAKWNEAKWAEKGCGRGRAVAVPEQKASEQNATAAKVAGPGRSSGWDSEDGMVTGTFRWPGGDNHVDNGETAPGHPFQVLTGPLWHSYNSQLFYSHH